MLWVLEQAGSQATFFAAAVAFEKNPEVARAVIEAGHDVCSHGYRWVEHSMMSEEVEREAIRRAVISFTDTCGAPPIGWYCRYGPSVNTRRLLVEHGGFLYDSDSYADEIPYYVDVAGSSHLVIPYGLDLNDVKYVLPQGYASGDDFVSEAKRAIARIAAEAETTGTARMLSIGTHPRLFGRPVRADVLAELLEFAQESPDVWVTRREDIARYWLENFPPERSDS